MVWRALETAVRETKAVYATPASGGMYNCASALRQRVRRGAQRHRRSVRLPRPT